MRTTYDFDTFDSHHRQSESARLTQNVKSHELILANLLSENGLKNGSGVLEVGCGTGAVIALLAELFPNSRFTGVDQSHLILDEAHEITEPWSERVELLQSDGAKLPFLDNSYDFVFTRLVLMHNQVPLKVIQEMVRVCKPGGTVCAIEYDSGTQVFYPHGDELEQLIRADILYARSIGCDRMIGRKLYSMLRNEGLQQVKVVIQTSDFSEAAGEVPIGIRLALGKDEGQHLVNLGFLTDLKRTEILEKVDQFMGEPHRFESGSFMYAFGKKE